MANTKLIQTKYLEKGMVLAHALKLQTNGEILVPAGTEINNILLELVRHLPVEAQCCIVSYEFIMYHEHTYHVLLLAPVPSRARTLLPARTQQEIPVLPPGKRRLRWVASVLLLLLTLLLSGTFLIRMGVLFQGSAGSPSHTTGTTTDTTWEGGTYSGTSQSGIPHGHGSIVWPDGTMYIGEWQGGRMEGEGEIIWSSGTLYKGHWQEGLMHGKGEMLLPDGTVLKGTWEYGRLKY